MKTFKNLYPKIYSFESLEQAFIKARRGKRHKPNVAQFEVNLDQELLQLQEDLQNKTYQPGGYRHFHIYDGKPRRISAAPFRDRVVHHALCLHTEPIWEARFISDSYACRAGKGTHAAMNRCTQFAQQYPYVLQCDIQQFFPSVDHQILFNLLGKHVACPPTLRLIKKIISTGNHIHQKRYQMQWFPNDDLFAVERPRGLPIGNQTSQFWANVYLHQLDMFVKQTLRCKAYARYCDDFMLFAHKKPILHQWRRQIEGFLESLRLKIHKDKTSIHPVTNGIPFLGFIIYPNHRRLKRQNGYKFQRKYKILRQQYANGQIDLDMMTQSVQSWLAHAAHGNTIGLQKSILKTPIPKKHKV